MNASQNLMNETQAAEYLGFGVKTLQSWRWRKIGPRYIKIAGSCVRYRPEDLDAHLVENTIETRNGGVKS